jgi:dephospho-CoA kinase
VSNILKERHVPVIDADDIAHNIILPGTSTYYKVVAAFGKDNDIFQDECQLGQKLIDRKKLGAIIFSNDTARRKLNSIMSGAIAWEIGKQILYCFFTGTSVVVLDVPLLFETGMNRLCHEVVVVYINPEVQLQRLMARDKAGESDAKNRVASQKMSPEQKAKKADFVIDNSRGLGELQGEVEGLFPKLVKRGFRDRLFSLPVLLASILVPVAWALTLQLNEAH